MLLFIQMAVCCIHINPMTIEFDESQLRRLAQIEDEANCDIRAGFDWGQNLGSYLAQSTNSVSHDKFVAMLQENWGNVLSIEELEEVTMSFQQQLQSRVIQKLQSTKSS
jgi:4-hydroxy-3-methylbut-2-en-1-yl diphosphate synthase IspG/GcpE